MGKIIESFPVFQFARVPALQNSLCIEAVSSQQQLVCVNYLVSASPGDNIHGSSPGNSLSIGVAMAAKDMRGRSRGAATPLRSLWKILRICRTWKNSLFVVLA